MHSKNNRINRPTGRISRDLRSHFRVITCIFALLLIPYNAFAEDISDTNTADSDEFVIKTTAKKTKNVEDLRFASGFVSRVEVGDRLAHGQSLADALEEVSGVQVRRESSLGQSAFVSVRGGTPRQLVVSFDGIRISAPAGIGFDIGQLVTEGIDSLEVYRGAAAVVQGAGALTGAVQLRTNTRQQPGWDISATTMAGSFGTFGGSATANVSGANSGLRLGASWRQSEGDFDFVDEQEIVHERKNNAHQRLGLLGAGNLRLGEHRLGLSFLLEQGAGGSAGSSEFEERFLAAKTDDDRLVSSLNWKYSDLISTDWLALDGRAALGYQRRGHRYNNDQGFLTRERFHSESNYQSVAATLGLSGFLNPVSLDIGNATHLELEVRQENYDAVSKSLNVPQSLSELSADRQVAAVALSNELFLFADSLSIIGGVRAEVIEDVAFSAVPVLPFGGVIWRVTTWLQAAANVARTFRAPDFDELYLNTESVQGDPDLDPERALAWDSGVTFSTNDDNYSVQFAYFQQNIDEMILFLPVSAYLYRAMNLENGRMRGVETNVHFQPHVRLSVDGNYTFTRAFLLRDVVGSRTNQALQLPQQPLHRARLSTALDIADLLKIDAVRSAQLTGAAHYRSIVNQDNFGNLTTPAAFTLDLGLSLGFKRWFLLSADIHNLFDARNIQDSLQRPLPGRAFYMSLRVREESRSDF